MVKGPKFVLARAHREIGATGRAVYFYWSLRSGNGEIICQSETYRTKRAAVNAIHRVIDICGRLAKREHIIEDKTRG